MLSNEEILAIEDRLMREDEAEVDAMIERHEGLDEWEIHERNERRMAQQHVRTCRGRREYRRVLAARAS